MGVEVVVFKSNLLFPCRVDENHIVSMSLKSSLWTKKSNLFIRSSSINSQFYGRRIIPMVMEQQQPSSNKRGNHPQSSNSQMTMMMMSSICIGKAQKWWEKGLESNMIEITSAQHLVDSLANSGDQLVVLAFFSPGCGGCKALHPKICQLAEMNPDVKFLQVNYEQHKSMSYSLNVHVLPFFRFYRGSHGRLCSFSCTNATIKKFKDALAKHSPDRCSLGPAKGLEEKELLALSANKDLSFNYTPKPVEAVPLDQNILAEISAATPQQNPIHPLPLQDPSTSSSKESEDKKLVCLTAGR